MGNTQLAEPRRFSRLVWFVMPLLLIAALVVGGISISGVHAAGSNSPLNGFYNFRAIVSAGPATGLYLTGEMSLTINGGNVNGSVCGLRISQMHCTFMTGKGTSSGSSIHFALSHLINFSSDSFSGAYQTTAGQLHGFNGFGGTFTLGTSSGTWQARIGSAPVLSNSWNFFGIITKGPDLNRQFHGVLTLSEEANGKLTGTYCPEHMRSCAAVIGGRDNYGHFFFYISVFNQQVRLSGMVVGDKVSRISGQFRILKSKGWDNGYWLGH